jgi:hypothetical protein
MPAPVLRKDFLSKPLPTQMCSLRVGAEPEMRVFVPI